MEGKERNGEKKIVKMEGRKNNTLSLTGFKVLNLIFGKYPPPPSPLEKENKN